MNISIKLKQVLHVLKRNSSAYSVTVNGKTNTDCAWYYPVPSKEAEKNQEYGCILEWRSSSLNTSVFQE